LQFKVYGQKEGEHVKVIEFTLEQATKAQRGNKGIFLLFL